MRLFTAILLLFGLVSACTSPRGGPPRAGHANRDEVLRQISAPAGATFLSYNGRWQGTDIDKQITFKKDNRAEVTHFGFGVDTHQGTYTVEESGAIHLSLRKAPEPLANHVSLSRQAGTVLAAGRNATRGSPLAAPPNSVKLALAVR
jgi:hypothetical protein